MSSPIARQPRSGKSAPRLDLVRRALPDGAVTTVHVARFDRGAFALSVVAIDPCLTLVDWCAADGSPHALVGGFYLRPDGPALGDVWVGGEAQPTAAFDSPWHRYRACVHCDGETVALRPREEIEGAPRGDLLQAGPMLVHGGAVVVREGVDSEGFSAGSRQFDSDITAGRYPRAAFGLAGADLVAVACDGRSDADAGMTMTELAAAMADLGCEEAMNLDGGGSASLVIDGVLVNTPREAHEREVPGGSGREIATALRIAAR